MCIRDSDTTLVDVPYGRHLVDMIEEQLDREALFDHGHSSALRSPIDQQQSTAIFELLSHRGAALICYFCFTSKTPPVMARVLPAVSLRVVSNVPTTDAPIPFHSSMTAVYKEEEWEKPTAHPGDSTTAPPS